MSVKLLTEHYLEFISLKRGCTGWSESTLVKMPHCWKSHVVTHIILFILQQEEINLRPNRNFTTALRPSVPTMLPKSAQAAPSTGPPMMSGSQFMSEQRANNLNPLLAKQVSITLVCAFLYH